MQNSNLKYYNQTFLDNMRQTTDPTADEVIQSIFETGQARAVGRLMADLNRNLQEIPAHLPQIVKDYFVSQAKLPDWADQKQMQTGAAFFQKHQEEILSMLGFLSLPYCYAAADGARVLHLSERIREQTQRRLLETGQFVLDVMHPDAFQPQGAGYSSILKVRLMHAAVRFHILQSGKWEPAWGLPINQEDMGGTNGAFSWLVVRGLRKIGHFPSQKETEAYFHLWNVIGHLLGVRQELLPRTGKEAYWLDKRISERHFRKSEAGVALTRALMQLFRENEQIRLPEGFTESYMRFLLGDKVADILEIPPANWTQSFINPLRLVNNLRSLFVTENKSKSGGLSSRIQEESKGDQITFSIPLGLG